MSAPRIELHIEELVLHGFPPADRQRIAAALERELGRMIAARGEDFRPMSTPAVDAGSVTLRPGASPVDVGTRVAGALMGGLTR